MVADLRLRKNLLPNYLHHSTPYPMSTEPVVNSWSQVPWINAEGRSHGGANYLKISRDMTHFRASVMTSIRLLP